MAHEKWRGFKPLEMILSLLALGLIFIFVDIGKVTSIMASATPLFVLLAFAAYFSTVLLMAWRIRLVLRHMGEKISFRDAFLCNWGGLAASDYTPARSGYFVTPFLMERKAGINLEKGMACVLGPQIIEFFIKAAGAALGIVLIAYSLPQMSQDAIFLWAGVGVMLSFCVAMWAALFVPQAVALLRRLSFLPFADMLCGFVAGLQKHGKEVAGLYPTLIAISVVTFFLKGLEWYLFGMAIGVHLQTPLPALLAFVVLQPLVTVFQFAPVPTIAGLGVAEASAVASMSLMGVSPELAVAYALLTRAGVIVVHAGGIFQLVSYAFGGKGKK